MKWHAIKLAGRWYFAFPVFFLLTEWSTAIITNNSLTISVIVFHVCEVSFRTVVYMFNNEEMFRNVVNEMCICVLSHLEAWIATCQNEFANTYYTIFRSKWWQYCVTLFSMNTHIAFDDICRALLSVDKTCKNDLPRRRRFGQSVNTNALLMIFWMFVFHFLWNMVISKDNDEYL